MASEVNIVINAKDNTKGAFGNITGALGKLGKAAAMGVAGLAAGAIGAAAGIGAMVLKSAAASDELVELSDKTGISIEKLQEYMYIGDQTGTSLETVTGSIARMVRGMGDAAAGTGTAKDAFATLGVAVTNADGTLRDSETVFAEALTALGAVGNETERDALAMEIFGRSAQELNPLIDAGAEGMAAMADEAHKMGAVVGTESVEKLANLNDKVAAMKAGFGGVVTELATSFMPVFEGVLGWMDKTLMPFIRDTLVPWIQDNLPKAIAVLAGFWEGTLKPAIEAVWSFLSTVVIPFLQNTVVPFLQVAIPAAIDVLSAAWETILKPAIEAVWQFLSETVIPFLRDTIVPWFEENIPKAIDALGTAFTWLKDEILTPLSDGISGLVDWVKKAWEWLGKLIETLKSAITIPDWLQALLGHSPSPFETSLRGIVSAMKELNTVTGTMQGKLFGSGTMASAYPLGMGRGGYQMSPAYNLTINTNAPVINVPDEFNIMRARAGVR